MGRFQNGTFRVMVTAIALTALPGGVIAQDTRSPGASVLRHGTARQPQPRSSAPPSPDVRSPSDQPTGPRASGPAASGHSGRTESPQNSARSRQVAPDMVPDITLEDGEYEYIVDGEWHPAMHGSHGGQSHGGQSHGGRAHCGPEMPRGFWANVDYLLWWRQGQNLPPLVTTEPAAGALPDASILFGGDREGTGVRPGGRFRVGGWLDMEGVLGVEASLIALGNSRFQFAADSDQHPTLARPFFNLTPDGSGGFQGPDAFLVASATAPWSGNIDVAGKSEFLAGDVLFRGLLSEGPGTRLELLAGYQWTRIDEALSIYSRSNLQAGTFEVFDSFATQNRFHGGAIGLELTRSHGLWNLELLGKIGFGNMQQTVMIDGNATNSPQGGLLAQPSNIGHYQRNAFAVSPEVGVTLNRQVTECCNFTLGYSLLFWNKVAQPGDQIDAQLAVNPNQPPPAGQPARPEFEFRDSSYYVHGLNIGLEFAY